MKYLYLSALSLVCMSAYAVPSKITAEPLGVYPANTFSTFQSCNETCQKTNYPALWYFKGDIVAVPNKDKVKINPSLLTWDDVLRLSNSPGLSTPPLLWTGATEVDTLPYSPDLKIVPKIASNLSYYNDKTKEYFKGEMVRVKQLSQNNETLARTIWSTSNDIPLLPSLSPLKAGESVVSLVREPVPAKPEFRTLYKAPDASTNLAGKPVMALILNGAQGDDDEAHGGHFAVAAGRMGPQGQWNNLLVTNFYGLGSISEKGILPSVLPMDSYMTDLNSGQAWYRPSHMMLVVMKSDKHPKEFQNAVNAVMAHYYRQDFNYDHALRNCTGLSMHALAQTGWQIAPEGNGGTLKAIAAYPYMAIKDLSFKSGRKAVDYLITEKTTLYPFAGFNAAGSMLLNQGKSTSPDGQVVRAPVFDEVESVIFVKFPQIPSSRAMGQAPVISIDEYMDRAPKDKKDWKIIDVPPRPFPDGLKDANAPKESPNPSYWVELMYQAAAGILVGFFGLKLFRKLTKKG